TTRARGATRLAGGRRAGVLRELLVADARRPRALRWRVGLCLPGAPPDHPPFPGREHDLREAGDLRTSCACPATRRSQPSSDVPPGPVLLQMMPGHRPRER